MVKSNFQIYVFFCLTVYVSELALNSISVINITACQLDVGGKQTPLKNAGYTLVRRLSICFGETHEQGILVLGIPFGGRILLGRFWDLNPQPKGRM